MAAGEAVVNAQAGAAAIEDYFTTRGLSPITSGDGRFVIYVPGNGEAEDLQFTLAATPAARGILVRVKARRSIEPEDWGRALVLVNKWNRSCPLPHAVLSANDAAGAFFLEGSLPASPEYPEELVARFIDSIVLGARQFWSGAAIRAITHSWGPLADADAASE